MSELTPQDKMYIPICNTDCGIFRDLQPNGWKGTLAPWFENILFLSRLSYLGPTLIDHITS